MIYAITTHSFLVIVKLDPNWQIHDYQVLNTGYHYGIGIIENGETNGLHPKDKLLAVYRGGKASSKQNDKHLMLYRANGAFELVDSIPLGEDMGDVHQIAYANGGLYIVNTGHNSLVYENIQDGTRHEYFFGNLTYDWNHVNSVYPCGDQMLVMLHNKSHQESQVAVMRHDPAKGFTLERTASLWHFACHNLFFDRNHLLYNASPAHALVKVDIEKKRVTGKISFEGHSKGLSVTSDYLAVGLSEDTFRDRRSVSKGQLAIIDRRSFTVVATVDLNFPSLPHPIGNVNEVRCLSGDELAHTRPARLEVIWSSLQLAESRPVQHRLLRAKVKLLLPLRRMKQYVRQRLSSLD